MTHDSFVSIHGVSKTYPTPDGQVFAVDDVSFDIGRGHFVSVLGWPPEAAKTNPPPGTAWRRLVHADPWRVQPAARGYLPTLFSASERFDGRICKSSKRMADVDHVARFSRDAVDAVLAEVDRELAKCVSQNLLRDQSLDRAG